MPGPLASDNCPAARALDVVGKRWALLLVREALGGPRHFGDFRAALDIGDHTLSRRLAELVECGVLMREPGAGPRHRYRLTEAGRDLAPVLIDLARWGERWTTPDPERPPPRPRPSWMSAPP
ncbi:MAG: winged helix-turn-helix transcriptional regulator [Dermatophilaceae bacterium]